MCMIWIVHDVLQLRSLMEPLMSGIDLSRIPKYATVRLS